MLDTNKIAALEAAGIDVNAIMNVAKSLGMMTEEDWNKAKKNPEVEKIFANGYIKNMRLHRRYIMAQMFNMMYYRISWKKDERAADPKKNFNYRMNEMGLKYSWRMAIEEARVQSILEISDPECFKERSTLFPVRDVIFWMAADYIDKMYKDISRQQRAPRKHCKGKPYVVIGHRYIYDYDVEAFMTSWKKEQERIIEAKSTKEFIERANAFYSKMREMKYSQSSVWQAAYKASGSYYTMQNMIRFHGCHFEGVDHGCEEKYLASMAESCKGKGYVLFAKMLDFVKYNNFDFELRMKELGVSK